MNRQGELTVGFLIVVALGLLVFVMGAYWIYTANTGLRQAVSCGGGASCKSSCGEGETQIYPFLSCSATAPACCKGPDAGGQGGTGGTGVKPSQVSLSAIASPTVRMAYQSGQNVQRETTLLYGMDETVHSVSGVLTYHIDAAACNADGSRKSDAPPTSVCKNDWKARIVLEGPLHEVIYDQEMGIFDGREARASGSNTNVLSVGLTQSQLSTNKDLAKSTFNFTITPENDELVRYFKNQRLHLIAYVYPQTWGSRPDLRKQIDTYLQMKDPLTITGLTPQWAKRKDITAKCVSPLTCKGMVFRVTSTTCTELPPKTPESLQTPQVRYVLYDNGEPAGVYTTEDECRAHYQSGQETTDYINRVQDVAKIFNTVGYKQEDLQRATDLFASSQNKVETPICDQVPYVPNLEPDKFYTVPTFNPSTQTGTFSLDKGSLAGKRLCVWGIDGVNNPYGVAPEQPIMIDLKPPVVTAKYDPWKLKVTLSCDDKLVTNDASLGSSGCKSIFGISYVSEIEYFFSALGKGPQNAAQYCPPYKTSGSYSPESRHEFIYNANEVRVMCVRAEDNAGNAAVTMITVYNGYDLLAKSIAMAVNR
jgi:hypothetical protein